MLAEHYVFVTLGHSVTVQRGQVAHYSLNSSSQRGAQSKIFVGRMFPLNEVQLRATLIVTTLTSLEYS